MGIYVKFYNDHSQNMVMSREPAANLKSGKIGCSLVPLPFGWVGVLSVGLSVFGPSCHIPLLVHGDSGH